MNPELLTWSYLYLVMAPVALALREVLLLRRATAPHGPSIRLSGRELLGR